MVVYHELMRQAIEALEAHGAVEKPATPAGFDGAGEGNLGDRSDPLAGSCF
ncbi:MAG: hypothetical protein OEM62_03915 [Acidobacteriota bacterium]|nr:hypothetical protein [Acidobacteriota bacterium]